MMKVTHVRKQKGHKKKKRPSGRESLASSVAHLISALVFGIPSFMDAISLQDVALTLLKNLGSSSRSARDRGREPANHSETTAFGPSTGKFKPGKFAKTDVVVRYADFWSNFI
ncbi:hypothetical protein E2C01_099668 [Portunus trituberculatus]|uniref:Uncharacterized protein n=1 Tax=Portunus trituberculatus TaxID=210409 RepID=A0A5B7K639_PORTR|nr:hypothetical protein [Portunus trituberculatus]